MNFPGLDPAWSAFYHAAHATGLRRTQSLAQVRAELDGGAKVIVVAPTALGDSLLTTPLLETLAARLGRERVGLLVKAPYAELYRDDPRLGRVFTVRGKFRFGKLREELRGDPHRVALLANVTEPDLIPYLGWCGVRGFLRYRGRWTRFPRWMANRDQLRRRGDDDYAVGHAIENNLAMAEALGLEATTRQLALPQFLSADESHARRVLIHPGASRANKRWPVERWAAVADAVVAEFGLEVAITGDRAEVELAESLRVAMKHSAGVRVLAGTLSLSELARAQAGAAAFLSGDTGPYHLAVALGCPTVTLFAATDRGSSVEACGPHGVDVTRHRVVATARFGEAVETISLERVWAEVRTVLGREGGTIL